MPRRRPDPRHVFLNCPLDNKYRPLIAAVRKWLNAQSRGTGVLGTAAIQGYFNWFAAESPRTLRARGLTGDDLSFASWSDYIIAWLDAASKTRPPVCPACGK